jgi:hypothetical protein
MESMEEKRMATTRYSLSKLILVTVSAVLMAPHGAPAQTPPQPVPLHKGCTGPIPPDYMVCKGPPVCKENGDGSEGVLEPGPALANGTSCVFTYQQFKVPSKCTAGSCTAPPPGTDGWFQPRYILIGVIYAPPGNLSSVSYQSNSTFGSTQDVGEAFGTGWSVGFTLGGVTTTTAETNTTTTDQSFTISKSQGVSVGMPSDEDVVDHDQDKFYIWTNPQIKFSQPYATVPSLTLNLVPADPSQPDPTRLVTVKTVRGADPDIYHVMDGWTDADKKNLLAQDPFVAQPTVDPVEADPQRFNLVQEIQVQGPGASGEPPPTKGIPVSSGSNNCQQITNADQSTETIGASYDFMGLFGVSASGSFSTTYSTSNQSCNGATQSATVSLESSTVGNNRNIAVYFDSLFATFAFVDRTFSNPTTPLGPNITGRIMDSSGAPLANQQINVTFANGVTRTLFSDADGNYTIVSPPVGPLTIRSGDLVLPASSVANKSAVIPLKVVKPTVPLPLPGPPHPIVQPKSL